MTRPFPLLPLRLAILVAALTTGWPLAVNATPPGQVPAATGAASGIARDVVLDADYNLVVQVVDGQGKPHSGTPIQLRRRGAKPRRAVTGNAGQLRFSNLQPGVYEVSSGHQAGIYRVWSLPAAPPKATPGILLIDDGKVVRGAGGHWQKGALIGGVIITSGVTGGVIGYNLKDAS